MPDYVLDAVRSIDGVKYAVPLYSGAALLKLRDGTYQAANVIGLDDTSLFGRPQVIGEHRGHLRRERLHRHQGRGILQAEDPQHRHRVRAQRPSRRHRRHRAASPRSGLFGMPDPLHDLQPRDAVHPRPALHDLLRAGRAEDAPPTSAAIKAQVAAARLPRAHRATNSCRPDLGLLQVPDRHRHQHPADDRHQLHRRAVDLRADVLHVHPREPRANSAP